MSLFRHASYALSAHAPADLPPASGAEVAVAGRSNAGKSSAINALANRKRLAFVSKAPGRTQQINYFRLGEGRHLVDLPGYGYAKVPQALKLHWEEVLSQFLQTRRSLTGLLLVMDCRHPLMEADLRMLEWFAPTGRPVHLLLTKADKLSRAAATQALARVQGFLARHYPSYTAQLFSSVTRQGAAEAEAILAHWLGVSGPENGHKKPPVKGE